MFVLSRCICDGLKADVVDANGACLITLCFKLINLDEAGTRVSCYRVDV